MLFCRPCNALESVFVQCNIRFATGVSFVGPLSVEKAEMALLEGLQVSGLDRLHVVLDEGDSTSSESSWRVALFESSTVTTQRISRSGKTLAQSLEEIVARDTPALGSAASYILINATDDDDDNDDDIPSAFGVIINANHALCDGQRMKACFEALLQNLMGAPAPLIELGALGDLTDASTKAVVVSQEPGFLPLNASSIVKLNEIPQLLELNPSESSVTIRRDIDAAIVKACRHCLQSKKATLTGFMMACWIQAISEVAAAAVTMAGPAASVSISCLVALGSQLPPALYTNAFGTVTVSGFGSLLSTTDSQNHDLASLLVDLAESCTQDLQTRIQRGEALSQCLALCRGEFDNGGPPVTIELSNHGMYHTTALTKELALQQRYDGYDGVSVSMVSESNSGKMRLTANAGAIFRHAAMAGLLERVVELWYLVGATQDAES